MPEDTKPTIRVSCENLALWPLWGDEGMVDPEALGLSVPLQDRLRMWTDYYRSNFTGDNNYLVTTERDAAWVERGRRLVDQIREELRGRAHVSYEER